MIGSRTTETLPAWGNETISLTLPSCEVAIEGLSPGQREQIAREYSDFRTATGGSGRRVDIRCRAGRLPRPSTLPAEVFTGHGEYAPRIARSGGRVEIVGFDSVAQLERAGPNPARAILAVAREQELARAFVLENFLRIVAAYRALDRGGVLLHSAAVVHRGRAFLFCGRADAGKTTLARKAAAAGARVLSDDINLVMPAHGGYHVHRVPFTGEFGRQAAVAGEAAAYPLGGLALLEKAVATSALPVRPAAAMAGLLGGCPFVNGDPEELTALMGILADLLAGTPVLRVGVAREDSFATIMTAVEEAQSRDPK